MNPLEDIIIGQAITIPFGKGAKTVEIYDCPEIELTYSKLKGSGDCWYPLTVYCPKCSNTHEFSSRGNEWKSKWLIEEMDYSFTVEYGIDDEGETFAQCSKCGFDLREEYIYGSQDESKEDDYNNDFHQVSLLGVSYADGCFVIPLESFKEAIREGYKRKATLFATVGSLSYKIAWEAYSNPDNIISKDKCVFLRKNLWKQA